VPAIIKIEYPEYAGLTALEGLCLDIHREIGLVVPRHWIAEVDGMKLIAIERFDRHGDGTPIAMESFFSVYAAGQRRVRASTDAELELVARMVNKLAQVADIDHAAINRELYIRILVAFLTGNGDLHLENMAFLGGPRNVRLAPVFDPSPMRAWDRHDLLSALPFEIDARAGLRLSVIALGRAFGLTRIAALEQLDDLGRRTKSYIDRIDALAEVPQDTREKLIRRVQATRTRLLATAG
jgi:serine/threonine-protein kinase HipA